MCGLELTVCFRNAMHTVRVLHIYSGLVDTSLFCSLSLTVVCSLVMHTGSGVSIKCVLFFREEKCQLHLELCHIVLYYSQYHIAMVRIPLLLNVYIHVYTFMRDCVCIICVLGAQVHVSSAQEVLGLSIDLSGALGKRTKFQVKETAQLVLTVTTASGTVSTTSGTVSTTSRTVTMANGRREEQTVEKGREIGLETVTEL